MAIIPAFQAGDESSILSTRTKTVSIEMIFDRKYTPRQAALGFLFISASISSMFLTLDSNKFTNKDIESSPEYIAERPDIDIMLALNGLCGRLITVRAEGQNIDDTLLERYCGDTEN